MSRLVSPPPLAHHNRASWRWWCARPISLGRRCRTLLTGVKYPVMETGESRHWATYAPTGDVVHEPCGHVWGAGGGWKK
jgi:hypothetical protein